MSLFVAVVRYLRERDIDCCLIGAAALAAHGVSRSTHDTDFFTTDARVLSDEFWAQMEDAEIQVRRGDAEDPLLGVVRLRRNGDRAVDVIAGRPGWQDEIAGRAQEIVLDGEVLRVAGPADLICLKLYAGGPQDLWDIRLLLDAVADREATTREVGSRVPALPSEARRAWENLLDPANETS